MKFIIPGTKNLNFPGYQLKTKSGSTAEIQDNYFPPKNNQWSFFYIAGYRDATPLCGHIKSNKYKILQKS